MVGFSLTYATALMGLFQWAVRQSAEVENQVTKQLIARLLACNVNSHQEHLYYLSYTTIIVLQSITMTELLLTHYYQYTFTKQ